MFLSSGVSLSQDCAPDVIKDDTGRTGLLFARVRPGLTSNVRPRISGFGDVRPRIVRPSIFGHDLGRQPQGEREEVEGGGRRGGWRKVRGEERRERKRRKSGARGKA